MFGYVVVNRPELKIKEYDEYQRYYCGLCSSLKDRYGVKGQISLTYDMTFLVMLLTGLYEPDNNCGSRRCIAHPMQKHSYVKNSYTDYVADMNVILTYYKCIDDWEDEHKLTRKLYADMLMRGRGSKILSGEYADKIKVITENLRHISELESTGSDDMDALSGHFGNIMAEICAPNHDEWETYLRTIGYYLGKFIYILDAYDDIEKDIGSGSFNPFICRLAKDMGVDVQSVGTSSPVGTERWKELADFTYEVLMMMAAPLAKEYEMLPIIENVGILRNIIYSGIWEAYYITTNRRICTEKSCADCVQEKHRDKRG